MSTFYSQYGEDRWITEHLHLPHVGTFVEVGADNGILNSNTYRFEMLGWQGVVIEPNPEALPDLVKNRRCPVEASAIGNDPARRYFIHPTPGWAGFDRGGREVPVHVRRLDDVLIQYKLDRIDLLSIDTEGSELEVWNTFDHMVWEPRIVVIEWNTEPLRSKELELMDVFYQLPYRMVHRTPANLIFERLSRF